MRLSLEPLSPEQIAQWDSLVAAFPQRRVFHRQAWFRCLAETQRADWRYWAVVAGGRTVGYFSGGIIRRGPFRLLGSPLRSWRTNHIGPLLEEGIEGPDFVRALDEMARELRISMVEIEYPTMPHSAYEAAGYRCHQTWTHVLPLSANLNEMVKRMTNGRRCGIRKAEREGLELFECDDAASLVHAQLSQTLAARQAICPFPASFPLALVRHLRPEGLIYTLGVRDQEGRILAAGLFPHDNSTVYQWESSSEMEGRDLHPNDLLHWGMMRLASERGLTEYDMSGYGKFNKAFGARLVAVHRWNKAYTVPARAARRIFERAMTINRATSLASRVLGPARRPLLRLLEQSANWG